MVLIDIFDKGTSYFQAEMDLKAILNGETGDKILDQENRFKNDVEIHIIRKRGS